MFDDVTVFRFWSKVDRSAGLDGCWPWQGMKTPAGYGRVKVSSKTILAHRFVLAQLSGAMPSPKTLALHACDNPSCCNPNHLRWGTCRDNADDRVIRGRSVYWGGRRIGIANPRCRLSWREVGEIRESSMGAKRLAKKYGVGRSTIKDIVARRTWK